jgi:tetratricopeptide (TPR) repeat protein
MSTVPRPPEPDDRIETWKQIGVFFGKDERTVKRWERERHLPIHRLPGDRGGVFAYRDELTAWMNSTLLDRPRSGSSSTHSIAPAEQSPDPPEHPSGSTASTNSPILAAPVPAPRSPWTIFDASISRWKYALLAVAIAAVAVYSTVVWGRRTLKTTSGAGRSYNANPTAREAYLMGSYYWNQRTGESLNRAVDAFTQAAVRDPGYALAYSGLAETYNLLPEYTSAPASDAYPKAIAAANQAIKLDDSLASAHRSLAFARFFWLWDVNGATAEYRKAIALDPDDVDNHHWYATTLLALHRMDEAVNEIDRARDLDPASRSILADSAFIHFWAGDTKPSIEKLRNLEIAEPDFLSPPRYLAETLFEVGDFPGFIEASRRAALISQDPRENAVADAAAQGWARAGRTEMLEQMRIVEERYSDDDPAYAFALGHTCALLGRKDDAVDALESAAHDNYFRVMTIFNGDIQNSLHGFPRFEQLKTEVETRMDTSN